jgi:cytochrome c oxidase subunit I
MLWAVGCLAVLAMTIVTFIAESAVVAHISLLASFVPGPGRYPQDTYFVVGHHVILRAAELAAVFGFFGGWYYFFPKITGFSYSERLGRIHFWLSIAGIAVLDLMEIILPALIILCAPESGILRYWNTVSPVGGYIFAAGLVLFFGNVVLSFARRRPAR